MPHRDQHSASDSTAGDPRPAQWRQYWPLWLFFLGVFLVFLKDIPGLLLTIVAGPTLLSPQLGALLGVSVLLLFALGTAALAPGRLSADQLGFVGTSIPRILAWTVAALAALYVPVWLGYFISDLGGQETTGIAGSRIVDGVAIVLTIAVVGPVAEEVAYRAVLFRAASDGLSRWLSPKLAAALAMAASSVVFMVVHAGAPGWHMLGYFCFGMVLCAAYWYTGSLFAALIPHLLNNAYAAVSMCLSDPQVHPVVLGIAWMTPVIGVGVVWLLRRVLTRAPETESGEAITS